MKKTIVTICLVLLIAVSAIADGVIDTPGRSLYGVIDTPGKATTPTPTPTPDNPGATGSSNIAFDWLNNILRIFI